MASADRQTVFFEVHQGLPREGPGNRASTWQALALTGLEANARLRVVDVGCGPGMQTLDLAERLPRARIAAMDLHLPFLQELAARGAAADVSNRVYPIRADMARLPLAPGSADLIWCEGAAYLMGVAAALAAWRPLLRPGGVCAFTEAVWLEENPPAPARDFWRVYPAMTNVAGNCALIRQQGFELLGNFVLPAAAWWDDYYGPMSERLAVLEHRYESRPDVLQMLAEDRAEIELFRRYGSCYGYVFLVAHRA